MGGAHPRRGDRVSTPLGDPVAMTDEAYHQLRGLLLEDPVRARNQAKAISQRFHRIVAEANDVIMRAAVAASRK